MFQETQFKKHKKSYFIRYMYSLVYKSSFKDRLQSHRGTLSQKTKYVCMYTCVSIKKNPIRYEIILLELFHGCFEDLPNNRCYYYKQELMTLLLVVYQNWVVRPLCWRQTYYGQRTWINQLSTDLKSSSPLTSFQSNKRFYVNNWG